MADNEYHNNHAPKNKVSNLKQNLDRDVSRIKNQVLKSRANLQRLLPKPLETFPASGNPSNIEFTENEIKILENMIYMLLLTLLLSTVNLHNIPEDIRKLASDIFSDKPQIALIEKGSGMSQPKFSGDGQGNADQNIILDQDDVDNEIDKLAPPDSTDFMNVLNIIKRTIPDRIVLEERDTLDLTINEIIPPNIKISFLISPNNSIDNQNNQKIVYKSNASADEYIYRIRVKDLNASEIDTVIDKYIDIVKGSPVFLNRYPEEGVLNKNIGEFVELSAGFEFSINNYAREFISFKNKQKNTYQEELNGNYSNAGSYANLTSPDNFGKYRVYAWNNRPTGPSDTSVTEWVVLPDSGRPFTYDIDLPDTLYFNLTDSTLHKSPNDPEILIPEYKVLGNTYQFDIFFIADKDTFRVDEPFISNPQFNRKYPTNQAVSTLKLVATSKNDPTKKDSTEVVVINNNQTTGTKEHQQPNEVRKLKSLEVEALYPNPTKKDLNVKILNNTEILEACKISIFNITGEELTNSLVNANSGENIFRFDVGYFTSGSYIVVVRDSKNKVTAQKLIKIN